MRSRLFTLLRVFLFVFAGLVLLFVSLRYGRAQQTAQTEPADPGPVPVQRAGGDVGIQSSNRISIPYGFEPSLPLIGAGEAVLARGIGGCTEGQAVTIDVSVEQAATGAAANAQWNGTCSGVLQNWQKVVVVDDAPLFAPGAAEACGIATTSVDGEETDTMDWCADVTLAWTEYAPLVRAP